MNPPHKRFFYSLKQVEKRLKLDDGNPPPPPPPPPSQPPSPPPQTVTQSTESSTSSPIYFHNHHTNTSSSTFNNSSLDHPPHEFLSLTDSLPNPNKTPKPQLTNSPQNDVVGGVDSMIDLLKLTEFNCKGSQMPDVNPNDMFYANIVKVKGPKCKMEVERLDGWISYFLSNEKEPFRLAHLLLAKAAVVGDGDGDVFEFPCTVDEFLHNDPPFDLD